MKFYSGKGDGGTSTLFGSGKRIRKNSAVFEVLGSLDELNSYLGICVALAKEKKVLETLENIQETLFIIQAEAGGAKNIKLEDKKLKELESAADKYGDAVGIITKFTLSGGTGLSAHLDYARTLARRAERKLVNLETGFPSGNPVSLAYLNRLSSLLFVLARYAAKKNGKKEKNPKYK